MGWRRGGPLTRPMTKPDRVRAEDDQRGGEAVLAATDHPGEDDRPGQQPDAAEALEQADTERRTRRAHLLCPMAVHSLDATLEDPAAGAERAAEHGRSERDRDDRGDHGNDDVEVAEYQHLGTRPYDAVRRRRRPLSPTGGPLRTGRWRRRGLQIRRGRAGVIDGCRQASQVKSVEIGGTTTGTGAQSYSMISAILRSPKSSGQRELNIALRASACNKLVTVSPRSCQLVSKRSRTPPNYELPESGATENRQA